MLIEYMDIIMKLMNKNIKNQITKNEIKKLRKLEHWYFTALRNA